MTLADFIQTFFTSGLTDSVLLVLLSVAGALLIAPVGLGRKEEAPRLALQPWRDTQLRVPVGRGGVDVVDAVAEQELERLVGDLLRDAADRRRAEDHARALVTGAAEIGLGDHLAKVAESGEPA